MDNFLNRISNLYNFDPQTSIPDLSGKVVLVTGANTGLGYQTVLQIAQHNPSRIYLTARSKSKFDTAMAELQKVVPSAIDMIHFVQLDLASLASVKRAASEVLSSTSRLDILINNAGIMGAPPSLTTDGYEAHFGTNHMGHALLTKLLMPVLLRTAEQPGSDVRIVNVSSGAYLMTHSKGWTPELVKTDMASFGGSNGNLMSRYGQSKLANVLHAKGLAKHYPSITAVAIAPGRVKTELLSGMYNDGRDKFYGYFQKFYDVFVGAHTVEVGTYSQLWAATEPKKERVESGGIYFPVGKRVAESKFAKDQKMVDGLWVWTEKELADKGY